MTAQTIRDSVSVIGCWMAADNAELWRWLNSPRSPNFDDFGPASPVAFLEEMDRRSLSERRWMVRCLGHTVGYIAFLPQSPICGTFHGVCIAPEYRGRGVGKRALELVIADLVAHKYKAILASFFADNEPVFRLFRSLGFAQWGYYPGVTMRDLESLDLRVMGWPPVKSSIGFLAKERE